jgi:hypothetical protein
MTPKDSLVGSWTRTAPTEPGWYWVRQTAYGQTSVFVTRWRDGLWSIPINPKLHEFGPRVPPPDELAKTASAARPGDLPGREAIEAAKEALNLCDKSMSAPRWRQPAGAKSERLIAITKARAALAALEGQTQ